MIALLAPVLAAALAAGEVLAESPAMGTPGEAILVLRGGQVLRGEITRAGDLYYVVLPNGEIRIHAEQVELVCRSIDEAYLQKRAAIRVGNVLDHLDLAEWCLRQKHLDAASRELSDAAAADPTHRMIPYLARRIELARGPALPEVPGGSTGQPAAASATLAGPTADEIDSLTRTMPPGAVQAFTATIQPLLVSRCGDGGCHGPQSQNKLALWRFHPGRPVSKRLTQRNLHAVLQCVDRQRPEASPLLQAAVSPHGTTSEGVLAGRDADKYRQLVEWVATLGTSASPAGPQEGPARSLETSATSVAVASPNVLPRREPPPATAEATPAGEESPFDLPSSRARPTHPARSTPKRGTPPPKFVPVDPFDPEIFNRRFWPTPQQAASPPPNVEPPADQPPTVNQPAAER